MSNVVTINPADLGSLNNAIYRQTASLLPQPGMGATRLMYTDRVPLTIVKVVVHERPKLGDRVWVVRDEATPNHRGLTESQDWAIVPTPVPEDEAALAEMVKGAACYSWRKNGRWVLQGSDAKTGEAILIGERLCYQDPSF